MLKYTLNFEYLKLENQVLTWIGYLNLLTIFFLDVTERHNSINQFYWRINILRCKTNKVERPLIVLEKLVY